MFGGPSLFAHLAHITHEALAEITENEGEVTPSHDKYEWSSKWQIDPISMGIHTIRNDSKPVKELQIRIMDNGIMFVAIRKLDKIRFAFVIFQQFGGKDVDLMLRDSTGEYKIQTTIFDIAIGLAIATSLSSFIDVFSFRSFHASQRYRNQEMPG